MAIDDGSTDDSYEYIIGLSIKDPRVKILQTAGNLGPSAARNVGLYHASGAVVAYLDSDDEYYPEYLETVSRFRSKGNVLIFGYDVIDDTDPRKPVRMWDPTPYKDTLFSGNIATPLGISHRRDLGIQVGGFNEDLYGLEDWDLLKRMARAGADFLFLPFRSGLYHIREASRSRRPKLTERQKSIFEARRKSGTSLYGGPFQASERPPIRKVLLTTPVFPFDPSNATARTLTSVAGLLARSSFACQGFSTSMLLSDCDTDFEHFLSHLGLPFQFQDTTLGPHSARMIYTHKGSVPVSIFRTRSTRQAEYHEGEGGALLDYYEQFLGTYQPDAIITCNPGPKPDPIIDLMFHIGKSRDIPIVLWLTDTSLINPLVLQSTDYCVVDSEALSRRYWDTMGLVCHVLPPIFDWDRVRIPHRDPQTVFIAASKLPAESLFSARIIEQLSRRRPDILVAPPGPDVNYVTTKVLLVPSFGLDTFDRTAAEALINGIPVLASNRGSLPEILGPTGFLIDIRDRHTPTSVLTPDAAEIEPWVEAIIRLWDDPNLYRRSSEEASRHSLVWHPSRVAPLYTDFFRHLTPQPGPPLIPGQGSLFPRERCTGR